MKDKLEQFVRRMPKINLHVHIEGAIQSKTLLEIATENGYIDELNDDQVKSIKQDSFVYVDFPRFIDTYSMCANALKSAADYERVTYEYLLAAHEENIRYVEAYISPYDRMRRGVAFEEIVSGASAAIDRANKECGIMAHIVMDVGRHLLWSAQKDPIHAHNEALRLVELIIKHKHKGIVGFSIGGKEKGFPVYPFVDAFSLARENGLHVKAHAGEASGVDDIWYVVGLLNVERVGHAISAVDDPALLKYMQQNQITIEVCPTGNILTGVVSSIENHPIQSFLQANLSIAIGDDDPALFDTTLTSEYMKIMKQFNLSADAVQSLAMNPIEAMWVDDNIKTTLRNNVSSEFNALRRELDL